MYITSSHLFYVLCFGWNIDELLVITSCKEKNLFLMYLRRRRWTGLPQEAKEWGILEYAVTSLMFAHHIRLVEWWLNQEGWDGWNVTALVAKATAKRRVPFIKPDPKRSFWAAEGQNDTKIDFKVIGFEVVGYRKQSRVKAKSEPLCKLYWNIWFYIKVEKPEAEIYQHLTKVSALLSTDGNGGGGTESSWTIFLV